MATKQSERPCAAAGFHIAGAPPGRIDTLASRGPTSAKHTWRVLYLFARIGRQADFGDALEKAVTDLNDRAGHNFGICTLNLDILRGRGAHGLLSAAAQQAVIDDILATKYDLVLLASPCSTTLHNKELIDFMARAARIAAEADCLVWLELPEDLGECNFDIPASPWQLKAFKDLEHLGLRRGAIFQCEWSQADDKKPTGLLTNVTCMIDKPSFYQGWPEFDEHDADGRGRVYRGPLPKDCSHHAQHAKLIKNTEVGTWQTATTAAYPPEMCKSFAELFVQELLLRMGQISHPIPAVGGRKEMRQEIFQTVPLHMPIDLASSEIVKVERIANKIMQQRGSISMGLCAVQEAGKGIAVEIQGDGADMRELNAIVLDLALRAGRTFSWTSLQYLRNAVSGVHTDDGIRLSLVIVVGDFTGGQLHSEGHPDLELSGKAVFFDPSVPHEVKTHRGDRIALVAYNHPLSADIKAEQAKRLIDFGFKLKGGQMHTFGVASWGYI